MTPIRQVPPPGSNEALEQRLRTVERDVSDWGRGESGRNEGLRRQLDDDRVAFLLALKALYESGQKQHAENVAKLEFLVAEMKKSATERESRKAEDDPEVKEARLEARRAHLFKMTGVLAVPVIGLASIVLASTMSWCKPGGTTPVPAYAPPPATLTPYTPPPR